MIFFKQLVARYDHFLWQRRYQINKHLQTVSTLLGNIDGFHLSKSSRPRDDLSLTYGEINLLSFLALLSLTHPKKTWTFYDLGCGTGKTVLAASLCYQFRNSIGIECLPALIDHAHRQTLPNKTTFICGDILSHTYHDADLIFINIASFIPELWENLSQKLRSYSHAYIITCAKPLPDSEILHRTWVECTWGIIPAYIQKFNKKE